MEMSLVFLSILREDENVVDVHPYKNPQVVSKDIIHNALERRWRVTEAKGHNNPFKGAKLCVEGGFLDIFVMDSNLMEPTDKVYLRKYSGIPQCTKYRLDLRQRISISDISRTQRMVVDAQRPFTIRFLHQQATRSIWTQGWSNSARSM